MTSRRVRAAPGAVDKPAHKPVDISGMASVWGVDKLEQAGLFRVLKQLVHHCAVSTQQWRTDLSVGSKPVFMRLSRLLHISTDHNIQSTTIS